MSRLRAGALDRHSTRCLRCPHPSEASIPRGLVGSLALESWESRFDSHLSVMEPATLLWEGFGDPAILPGVFCGCCCTLRAVQSSKDHLKHCSGLTHNSSPTTGIRTGWAAVEKTYQSKVVFELVFFYIAVDTLPNHVKPYWPTECVMASDGEDPSGKQKLKVETKVNVELHRENQVNHSNEVPQDKENEGQQKENRPLSHQNNQQPEQRKGSTANPASQLDWETREVNGHQLVHMVALSAKSTFQMAPSYVTRCSMGS